MHTPHIQKPPIWKTLGIVSGVCIVALFICVYMLFSGIHAHDQLLQDTEHKLQQTQNQLQITTWERDKLKQKINRLEQVEQERGYPLPPLPPSQHGGNNE